MNFGRMKAMLPLPIIIIIILGVSRRKKVDRWGAIARAICDLFEDGEPL